MGVGVERVDYRTAGAEVSTQGRGVDKGIRERASQERTGGA